MDLTEDMLDAVLIKIDPNAYHDRGDFSSDYDSDDEMYHIRIGEQNDPSDKSSESSSDLSDSSALEESESLVSYNHSEIKLMKPEVRLPRIDASLFQLKKVISTSVKNVENSGKDHPTLSKTDETRETIQKVNENAVSENPNPADEAEKNEKLPTADSLTPKIAPKLNEAPVPENLNSEGKARSGKNLQMGTPKLLKILSNIDNNSALENKNSETEVGTGENLRISAPKSLTTTADTNENSPAVGGILEENKVNGGNLCISAQNSSKIAPEAIESSVSEDRNSEEIATSVTKSGTSMKTKMNDKSTPRISKTSERLKSGLQEYSSGGEEVTKTDKKSMTTPLMNNPVMCKETAVSETCKNLTALINNPNESGLKIVSVTGASSNEEVSNNETPQETTPEVTIKQEEEPISPDQSSQVQQIVNRLEELKGTISTSSSSINQSHLIEPLSSDNLNVCWEEASSNILAPPPQNDPSPNESGLKPAEIKSLATTKESLFSSVTVGVSETKTNKQSVGNAAVIDESDAESDHDGLCIDLNGAEGKTPPKQGKTAASGVGSDQLPKLTVRNFESELKEQSVTTTEIKQEQETIENKLTLYNESDLPSVMTVHLLCMNCIEYAKERWPDRPLIKHILVKKKDCEVCKTKDVPPENTATEQDETVESITTNLSNVEKIIDNVARNYSKKLPSSPPSKSSLEESLKDVTPKTKGVSSQDIILVNSSNVSTNLAKKGSNIIIKDVAMKNAIKNASRNLKPSGMTTLDGKLYKVIFLPKSSSPKTIVTSTTLKIADGPKTTTKVVTSNKSASLISSSTVTKLTPASNSSPIIVPAAGDNIISNPNVKKTNENLLKFTSDVPTVPNRTVFSPPKSSTFTTSLLPNSLPKKKLPSQLSFNSETIKIQAPPGTPAFRNIASKRVSLDLGSVNVENSKKDSAQVSDNIKIKRLSTDSHITLSPGAKYTSKLMPLNDYLALNRTAGKTGSTPMKVIHHSENAQHGSKVSAPLKRPITIINGKPDNIMDVDDGAITMSTNSVKRPRMSVEKGSPYLSNCLDDGAKISILNSVLLPPFCPTTPDSIYDAKNPVAKYTCPQCPDTFTSETHLRSHLNRRSVLMKYACPGCFDKLIAVYNRCQLKEHCQKHNLKVNLQHLTIEPLPLALFDLNLFDSSPSVSNNVAKMDALLQPKKRKRKSRAKKKPENTDTAESNPSCSKEAPAEATSSSAPTLNKNSQKSARPTDTLTFCYECESMFPSLSAHLQGSGKPNAEFACECKKVCSSACSLKAHKRLHHNSAPHICPECGAKFLFASALEEHFKKSCYHPFKKNSFECLKCQQNFSVLSKLESHVLKNHTEQVNICGVCEESDVSLSVISKHMSIDHGETVNQNSNRILRFMRCDFCPDARFPRHQCHQHIQMHTTQQSSFTPNYYYQCDYCTNYKTVAKIDFGQHLDYCLFSTSLRMMENNTELSDSEDTTSSSSKSVENLRPSNDEITKTANGSDDINEISSQSNSSETMMSVDKVDKSGTPTSEYTDVSLSKSSEAKSVRSDKASVKNKPTLREPKIPETISPKEETGPTPNSDSVVPGMSKAQVLNSRKEPTSLDNSAEINLSLEKTLKKCIKRSEAATDNSSNKKRARSNNTSPKLTVMQCKYCVAKFRDPQKVFEHLMSKHRKEISEKNAKRLKLSSQLKSKSEHSDESSQSLECSKCSFVGASYADLCKHMETHKTVYECKECGEGFVARPTLEKHLIIKHKFDAVKAKKEVDSNIQSVEVVKENGAYHAKQGFYQCATCYKNFTTEQAFNQHFRTHGLAFVTDSASPTSLVK
nr:PREDICTED: zinc finger protein 532-like [Bemisia tabaci]XP_018908542.1 PREDICTED: zinc finger protein 532-like [Bemisia tabaci]